MKRIIRTALLVVAAVATGCGLEALGTLGPLPPLEGGCIDADEDGECDDAGSTSSGSGYDSGMGGNTGVGGGTGSDLGEVDDGPGETGDEPSAAAGPWMWSTYGDSRCSMGSGSKHRSVLEELVSTSGASEVVWNLGDIVPGSGWDTFFSDIEATLGPNTQTEAPYYYGVTGDHDGDGTTEFNQWLSRQAGEFGNSGNGWNNAIPHRNALFVNLNMEDNTDCSDGSLLHSAITAGGYDWLFGVYHYRNTAGDCADLLESHGMDGYFWGHNHGYAVTSLGGAISINTGLGGCGTEYMEVAIDGDTATMRQIAVGGTVEDTQTVTRRTKPWE